jgi:hypothetical protein
MPATIALNYEQAINLINNMNQSDKEKLSDYLNEITLQQWLLSFRNRMKNIPVTFDEITEIVEEVRKRSY